MAIVKKINKKNTPATSSNMVYNPIRSLMEDFFFPAFVEDFNVRSPLSVNVWEEKGDLYIQMAMPGVKKDDIDIEVNADTITIRGVVKKEEKDEKDRKYFYKSLEETFEQTFNLPAMIDSSKAEATYKNGILTVKLPKAEQFKAKKLSVKSED